MQIFICGYYSVVWAVIYTPIIPTPLRYIYAKRAVSKRDLLWYMQGV